LSNTSARTATPPHPLAEWTPVLLGLIALYIPTYIDLAQTLWRTDDQGHGPIILAISLWFFWQKKAEIHALTAQAASAAGWSAFIFGLLLYVLGRSQDILLFEIGSQIVVVAGLLLIMRGWAAVKLVWFPLLFLVFMVPLPSPVVDALTLPMKLGVSWATEHILYALEYPISRSGVILQIGQYKLLVADACAGLHTLFTLEAMGLLYLHITRHESWVRNVSLAILIIPISFTANTIRVIALTLVTYYYGDEAGQGFLHDFAGMVLFLSALLLIMAVDSIIQWGVGILERRGIIRTKQEAAA
jgi:exosortase B